MIKRLRNAQGVTCMLISCVIQKRQNMSQANAIQPFLVVSDLTKQSQNLAVDTNSVQERIDKLSLGSSGNAPDPAGQTRNTEGSHNSQPLPK